MKYLLAWASHNYRLCFFPLWQLLRRLKFVFIRNCGITYQLWQMSESQVRVQALDGITMHFQFITHIWVSGWLSHGINVILSTEGNVNIGASPEPGLSCHPYLLQSKEHVFLTDDLYLSYLRWCKLRDMILKEVKSESGPWHGVKCYSFLMRCANCYKDCPSEHDLAFSLRNAYATFHLHTKL